MNLDLSANVIVFTGGGLGTGAATAKLLPGIGAIVPDWRPHRVREARVEGVKKMVWARRILTKVIPQWIRRSILVTKRSLVDTGYLRSARGHHMVDADGYSIPWYTYPSISYLKSLELNHARVLEFGSGNSTMFWERAAREVVSVEHDPEWYQRMQPQLDPGTKYILATDEASYVGAADESAKFDVIIVDGWCRRLCGAAALKHRAEGGIIVLDNSDWFPDIAHSFRESGLVEVDFAGFGPVQAHTWTTSVFFDGRRPPSQADGTPHIPPGGTAFSFAVREQIASEPHW